MFRENGGVQHVRRIELLFFLMKNINVKSKSNELVSVLKEHFGRKINQARIKLMSLFIISLCKVQTVNFEQLSNGFETGIRSASSLRQIKYFIAEFSFDNGLIALKNLK